MLQKLSTYLFASLAILAVSAAWAAPKPGAPAPVFTAVDTRDNAVALSELRGRKVILEWTNHDCPYVQKHYDSGNMQALQRDMAAQGIVWVTIISSAPGRQGHVSAAEANALTAERNAAPNHVILDPDGAIGRAYDARTTPHMFLIDEDGIVQYMGAIDDKPSSRPKTVKTAHNYVRAAHAEIEAGNSVSNPATKPYGCSVKYDRRAASYN